MQKTATMKEDELCSLDDDDYINDVSSTIPVSLAQGPKDLSDDGVIWEWLNIRAHAKQH